MITQNHKPSCTEPGARRVDVDCQSGTDQNLHSIYVQLKKQWDIDNPSATPAQRDAAINKIAQKCGV